MTDTEINSQKRIKAALDLREADRIPLTESCFWPDTLENWHQQGLPEDVDPQEYFELDQFGQFGPFSCDLSKAFPYEVYEENDEFKVDRNGWGVKVKYFKERYATHKELEHAVEERADWDEAKWALDVDEARIPDDVLERAQAARDRGDFVVMSPMDPYWFSFRMLGMENLMIQMAADPAFINDIYRTYTDWLLQMLGRVVEMGVEWDAIWFFSDMGYRNGPMFSPAFYRDYMAEQHSRVAEFCHSRGKHLLLHSDGNMVKLIPGLIEAGFDAIQPLEARAGNDVRELKPRYGEDVCFFGNISADVLARGDKAEIEEEVRTKVTAAKEGGGYIYHSDHSIPPSVSFDSYRLALECARKNGQF